MQRTNRFIPGSTEATPRIFWQESSGFEIVGELASQRANARLNAGPMRHRHLIPVLIAAGIAAWWFLRDDAEARVRDAHETLRELIETTGAESAAGLLLRKNGLETLFSRSCTISGDAGMFAGNQSIAE